MQQVAATKPLTRQEAMRILKVHEAEIRAQGVTRLALFGSTARDEARPDSDVDVLVDYDERRRLSLIDIAGLQLSLSDRLGREVELAARKRLKPFLKDNILAEAVEVFPRSGYRMARPQGSPMPPRTPRQRLQDILDSILFIEQHVAGRKYDDYIGDRLLRAAIERSIGIISEATRRLPPDLIEAHPDIPWPKISAIGSILRHEYDVYPEVIWNVAKQHMAPLCQAIEAMIATVEGKGDRDGAPGGGG